MTAVRRKHRPTNMMRTKLLTIRWQVATPEPNTEVRLNIQVAKFASLLLGLFTPMSRISRSSNDAAKQQQLVEDSHTTERQAVALVSEGCNTSLRVYDVTTDPS